MNVVNYYSLKQTTLKDKISGKIYNYYNLEYLSCNLDRFEILELTKEQSKLL